MTKKNNYRHCMVVFAHYPAGETRVQRQAEALINNGIEVDILCLRTMYARMEKAEEMVNGAHVYRLPVTRSYQHVGFMRQFFEYLTFFFRVMMVLFRLYPQRQYGVIQVHNLPDFLVFAAWYPKLRGAKLILDLHDLMPEFFAGRTGRAMDNWVVRLVAWQEKISCYFADHVITVTELWRQALIDRGVPADKISVVMNVADDRIFKQEVNRAPRTEDGTFHLFYHGALVPRYGINLVLEAISRLTGQIPGLRFTIHGKSEYQQRLMELTEQLNLTDTVHFSDKLLPMDQLPTLIKSADVGLVPYRYNIFTDGILPTKLMEYVALGVPVISARTSAIATYFDDTMVEYFRPDNVDDLMASILRLYQNKERRAELVQNAYTFNEKYNWKKLSQTYVTLVKGLNSQDHEQ